CRFSKFGWCKERDIISDQSLEAVREIVTSLRSSKCTYSGPWLVVPGWCGRTSRCRGGNFEVDPKRPFWSYQRNATSRMATGSLPGALSVFDKIAAAVDTTYDTVFSV
ncbi:unnamed protein product, partial [Callosobruchus maculatus]